MPTVAQQEGIEVRQNYLGVRIELTAAARQAGLCGLTKPAPAVPRPALPGGGLRAQGGQDGQGGEAGGEGGGGRGRAGELCCLSSAV